MAEEIAFIDTNIFLNLYSMRQTQAEKLLSRLEKIVGKLILTDQVRMEFLKNRQRLLKETYNKITQESIVPVPPIIAENKSVKEVVTSRKEILKAYNKLAEELLKMVRDPDKNDHIYSRVIRLVSSDNGLNLMHISEAEKKIILNRAQLRYDTGAPPRKNSDTSYGDAINWEWIISCATAREVSVVIASLDQDFGMKIGGSVFPNDYLSLEFKERTGLRERPILVQTISAMLEKLGAPVAAKQRNQEQEAASATLASLLASGAMSYSNLPNYVLNFSEASSPTILSEFIKQLVHQERARQRLLGELAETSQKQLTEQQKAFRELLFRALGGIPAKKFEKEEDNTGADGDEPSAGD